jgi:hypothetical protein
MREGGGKGESDGDSGNNNAKGGDARAVIVEQLDQIPLGGNSLPPLLAT